MSQIHGCPDFDSREFYCPGIVGLPAQCRSVVVELCRQLQVVRDVIQRPLLISSAYRTPEHNDLAGGIPGSFHLTGHAADVRTQAMTGLELFMVFEALIKGGQIREGGLGCYSDWVHYDIRTDDRGRPKRARWQGKSRCSTQP